MRYFILYKKWNKEKIIDDIRGLNNKTDSYNNKSNLPLYKAARRYFGSWKNAITAAGFDYGKIRMSNSWTKEKIIKKIRNLDYKAASDVIKDDCSLFKAAQKCFGSWKAAIEAAGFNYSEIRLQKRWTTKRVIKEIKKLDNKAYSYNAECNATLHAAAHRHFGTWEGAISAAGFDYQEIKKSYKNEDYAFDLLKKIFGEGIKRQHTFDWLKYKDNLYIDFYVDSLKLAIEYNGEQHYQPKEFFGGEDGFKLGRKRDNVKKRLLKKYGIKLIVIPYWEKLTEENIRNLVVPDMK